MESKKLILEESDINEAVNHCAKIIYSYAKYSSQRIVLVGILTGAVYFTTDLSRQLGEVYEIDHEVKYLEAKSYKGQDRCSLEIMGDLNPDKYCGKTVILVDELLDSGHTLAGIRDKFLEFMDSKYVKTCVCMQKKLDSNKVPQVIQADIVGIHVMDLWYVGYGLDNNGLSRYLREVYAIPKIRDEDKTKDDLIVFG
jgi:hypoxanthine phosphoribosyltransferase